MTITVCRDWVSYFFLALIRRGQWSLTALFISERLRILKLINEELPLLILIYKIFNIFRCGILWNSPVFRFEEHCSWRHAEHNGLVSIPMGVISFRGYNPWGKYFNPGDVGLRSESGVVWSILPASVLLFNAGRTVMSGDFPRVVFAWIAPALNRTGDGDRRNSRGSGLSLL